jgi:hypothetical protein
MSGTRWLRLFYFACFVFFTWLALATRHHPQWFHPLIRKYGGDVIWAGMFLFFLRVFFLRVALWKLAIICYALGVLDECSQLYRADWMNAIRATTLGRLMFGAGFLWSDILCYFIGTVLAFVIIFLIERQVKLQATSY